MNELGTEMESRYSTAKICSFEDANQENCEPILALEPGKIEILTASTIENNALVLPHFTSTPSNKKISMPLLRPYAPTVFKVYAKVRESAQFENIEFLCRQNGLMKLFQL